VFVFAKSAPFFHIFCWPKRVASHKSLPTEKAAKVRCDAMTGPVVHILSGIPVPGAFGNCCTQHVDKFLGNRWREVKEMDIRQLVTMSVGFASSLHTFGRLFSRNALAGWGKREEKPKGFSQPAS